MKQSGAVIRWLVSWSRRFNEQGMHMDTIWYNVMYFRLVQLFTPVLWCFVPFMPFEDRESPDSTKVQIDRAASPARRRRPPKSVRGKNMETMKIWRWILVSNWNEHPMSHSEVFTKRDWHDPGQSLLSQTISTSLCQKPEVEWKYGCLSDRPEVHPSPTDSGGLGRDLGLGTSSTTSSGHRSVPCEFVFRFAALRQKYQ